MILVMVFRNPIFSGGEHGRAIALPEKVKSPWPALKFYESLNFK